MFLYLMLFGAALTTSIEDPVIRAFLEDDPEHLVARSIQYGEIRPVLVPFCSHALPGTEFLDPFLNETGEKADLECRYVLGSDGISRLRKLEVKVQEYNSILKRESERLGLFRIYPDGVHLLEKPTWKQKQAIRHEARRLLKELLGSQFEERDTGFWSSYSSTEHSSRIFVSTTVSPRAVDIALVEWQEVAVPAEMLGPMHLSFESARAIFRCSLGKIDGSPAYALYLPETEALTLIVASSLEL